MRWMLVSTMMVVAAGCSSVPALDASVDVAQDARRDAAADAGADVGFDASPDVPGADVALDAPADVGTDAPQDVAQDVAQDVRQDVAQDVRQDVAQDVRQDVAQDVRQDVANDAPASGACTSTADCTGPNIVCGFAIADACSAVGACVMRPPPSGCGAIIALSGCGCDGTTVHWTGGCAPQFPAGYAPAPIRAMGPCS